MRTDLENILLNYAFDTLWNDDMDGESESPTGSFALFVVDLDGANAILNDATNVSGLVGQDLVGDVTPADLIGSWIVTQDSQGHLHYFNHKTTEAARKVYESFVSGYTAWLGDDD